MKHKFTIIAKSKAIVVPPSSVSCSSISFYLDDVLISKLKSCNDFENFILFLRNRCKVGVGNPYFSLSQMKRLNAFLNDCVLKYFDYTLTYE